MRKPSVSVSTLPAPSKEQEDILNWIFSHKSGALVVEAVAGSGKSTLLRMIAQAYKDRGFSPNQIIYLAFGREICKEMKPKLSGIATANTIHSHGWSAVRRHFKRVKLNWFKLNDIADNILKDDEAMLVMSDGQRMYRRMLLLDLLKKTMVGLRGKSLDQVQELIGHNNAWLKVWAFSDDAEDLSETGVSDDIVDALMVLREDWFNDISEILEHYAIDLDLDFAAPRIALLLLASHEALQNGEASFEDMINAPSRLGLTVDKFPVVLVDEAQDLSPAQREIAMATVAEGGQVIFVGDPRQAIFGFAGATCESIQEIVDATGADRLPLSVTYRCPTSHVTLARQIFPDIEAAPEAKEGSVIYLKEPTEVTDLVRSGDLLICRRTAPVISEALRLIAKGVPAKVKGRDVAKALIKVAEFVSSKDPMSRFLSNLEIYTNSKTAELANKRPYRLQLVLDQVEALESIFIANNPASVKDLEKAINSIFETKEEEDSLLGDLSKTPMVTLSTVHRAKGLEANRVFILDASRMKVNSRTEWQEKQEDNLHYVALTRSKDVLFISP